ncbi:S24 family peptidase [Enterobacter cloacae]|uniref:S24 family peptidase n=1 Tax=Enterobacter cloacae complex TaxID=354276 RepID=UPI00210CE309|nr:MULTISPECIES: S24 family peptidase [Enterobacter cloacae complex]MCQ4444279.1 S24 family peptidase [Enterobacter cloacae]MDW2866263.1 S24 family peptidase [Enterobacter hormaechei]
MTNAVAINQPIKTPQMLFGSDNINDFGNRVQSCKMEGDSMQPTIEPCEVVAFVDCGGIVLTPGIYVYTMDAFGRTRLFIKRIEPLAEGAIRIISDNHHYETFTLSTDEQKDIKIHGRVVASLAVRRFI